MPTANGSPLSSPEAVHLVTDAIETPSADENVSLRPWLVEGVALPAALAVPWLLERARPGTGRRGAGGPAGRLGADVRYWAEVAWLALELTAGQRFVPLLLPMPEVRAKGPDRAGYAAWRPVLGPAERRTLRELEAAMPAACRVVAPEGRNGGAAAGASMQPTAPNALLSSFLDAAVDALVRRGIQAWRPNGSRRPRAGRGLRGGSGLDASLPVRWAAALVSRDPWVTGGADEIQALSSALTAWAAPVLQVAEADPVRACFRLDAPEEEGEPWRLRFFLQAADEPSLLVPAAEVWRSRGRVLRYLNHRFDRVQERLLRGLGDAARLCPAIAESLGQPDPTEAVLDVHEAYRFLTETAALLEEGGHGVLLPAWWKRGPETGLGIRVRVRPARDEGGVSAGGFTAADLVRFDWRVALGDQELSPQEFEELARLKVPLVRMRGQWVALKPDEIRAAARAWRSRAERDQNLATALRLSLGLGEEAADETEALPVTGVEASGWVADALALLQGAAEFEPVPLPRGFTGALRPYQERGFAWLAFLRRWGLGACLADDMGLGKTVQTIALLLREKELVEAAGPALLVCPTSVVGNWQRELARFAPSLRVLVHHGTDRIRGAGLEDAVRNCDVVISSYALLHRDAEDLQAIAWSGVILDEAQNIKNPGSKQSQAARRLQAGYRIALTGTPVENHPGDLWSIMDFLNPGFLGPAARFRRQFTIPIQINRDAAAAERLRSLVQPFVLRRVKTDRAIISDLPEKVEMKVFCSLSREQATLYEAVAQDMMRRLEEAEDDMQRRGLVLATLTRLKQVCNHPAQFLADGSPLEGRSGKLDRLVEMLEEAVDEGDASLVFTQFAEMGELLSRHLESRLGAAVPFLHGGTPRAARERMIAGFQQPDGPPIFVLSLKAGGIGLNLTRANRVFHFDRWWNPAVEDQASDRAYRIGQLRTVHVHKLVTAGTLEERIDAILEEKRAVAGSLIGSGEAWLSELSTVELRRLITLGEEARV